jgi:tRNA A-37 threonylcarbamoyl transferase component Bud32
MFAPESAAMEKATQSADALPSTPPIPADEVDWTGQVLGEFRILHCLGKGGMGQVYLAEQTSLKRKVALKLLNRDLASNERSLHRFKAEAENVARATHANIVQIYTIGQANGINYIALEYVEGKNLREFIEKKGTPELALGLHIMMQVAAALQRASELGIIHRDIKPENILLTKKGEVKVADFGLSRCFAESPEQTSLTQSQVTMGTPLYMAPEQVERRPVDPRTDIYSFGVTCYHMFAGTPPFRGNSPVDVAYQHVHMEPQALAEIRPDLPAELFAIIQKMMAKKPEGRYQTAGEIVRDVNRLRESLNLGAVAAVSISSSFVGGASTHSWPETPAAPPQSRGALLVGLVLVALVAGLGIGWLQHRDTQTKDVGNGHVQPPLDDKDKKETRTKLDEPALKQLVRQYVDSAVPGQVTTGLQHSMELAALYLHERRYDDADALFADLRKPERRYPYRYLARMGHAIVLAYKDEPAESNKLFLDIAQQIERNEKMLSGKLSKKDDLKYKEELDAHRVVWRETHVMRELVANALNRNWANEPAGFPEKLEPYRHPPKATLKAPPAPVGP